MRLVACLLLGPWLSVAGAFELSGDERRVDLAAAIEWLADPGGRLTLADVRDPAVAGRFRSWDGGGDFNAGFAPGAHWLRVTLRRAPGSPGPWLVEIPYAYLREATLFAPGQPPLEAGANVPPARRPWFHRFPVFPVEVDDAPRVFHLRVASSWSLTVPLVAWVPGAFVEQSQRLNLFQALYYGGVVALVLYNLFLWVSLRDRRFFLYAATCTFFGLGMFAGNGLGRLFLWPHWPAFDEIASALLLCVASAFAARFAMAFLGVRAYSRWLDRGLACHGWLFAALAALLLGSLPGWVPAQPLFQSLAPLALTLCALIVLAAVTALRRGNRGARFFLLAWGVLILGVVVASLRLFGWVPTNALTAYAMQISSSFEMLLLAFALGDIVHIERQHRLDAQAEAIAIQRRMFDSLAASEERLQREVALRTQELAATAEREGQTLGRYRRFAALIAHEFRNPLAIIGSQVSLMRKEHERGLLVLEERLSIVDSAARRLGALFDKWLQGDRLEHALERIRLRPIALHPWLAEHVRANAHWLEGREVKWDLDPLAEEIFADEALLDIALGNLIENACKYSPPRTPLRLSTRVVDGEIGIAVSDRGPGIEPERHGAIFEPYVRGGPAQGTRGLGLGLSFVRRIAQAHGGRVALLGPPDGGSAFWIWLPRSDHAGGIDE
jgi:signal transduction histidine kinase